MYHFCINQFHVKSDLDLPCPPRGEADFPGETSLLSIRYERNALQEFPCVYWLSRRYDGEYLRAYDIGEGILICADNKVRMAIDLQEGNLLLDFDRQDEAAHALASVLIINLGVSVCTLLRGDLPLHAAGVELEGRFIGLMAVSGIGKSTLLWRLMEAGARFANDDVIPVQIAKDQAIAVPSISLPSKLSKQAIEGRGWNYAQFQHVFPDAEEFWIPIPPTDRLLTARPLAALFVLQPFQTPELPGQILVRRVTGAAAYSLLMAHTQGLWASYRCLDARHLFSRYATLLQSIPLYTLRYHRHFEVLPDLVRVIRQSLNSGTGPHE